MEASFADIPDELWERIKVWIPKRKHLRSRKGGRPPVPDWVAMRGILYRLRTGLHCWDSTSLTRHEVCLRPRRRPLHRRETTSNADRSTCAVRAVDHLPPRRTGTILYAANQG